MLIKSQSTLAIAALAFSSASMAAPTGSPNPGDSPNPNADTSPQIRRARAVTVSGDDASPCKLKRKRDGGLLAPVGGVVSGVNAALAPVAAAAAPLTGPVSSITTLGMSLLQRSADLGLSDLQLNQLGKILSPLQLGQVLDILVKTATSTGLMESKREAEDDAKELNPNNRVQEAPNFVAPYLYNDEGELSPLSHVRPYLPPNIGQSVPNGVPIEGSLPTPVDLGPFFENPLRQLPPVVSGTVPGRDPVVGYIPQQLGQLSGLAGSVPAQAGVSLSQLPGLTGAFTGQIGALPGVDVVSGLVPGQLSNLGLPGLGSVTRLLPGQDLVGQPLSVLNGLMPGGLTGPDGARMANQRVNALNYEERQDSATPAAPASVNDEPDATEPAISPLPIAPPTMASSMVPSTPSPAATLPVPAPSSDPIPSLSTSMSDASEAVPTAVEEAVDVDNAAAEPAATLPLPAMAGTDVPTPAGTAIVTDPDGTVMEQVNNVAAPVPTLPTPGASPNPASEPTSVIMAVPQVTDGGAGSGFSIA